MTRKYITSFCICAVCTILASAQTYTEIGTIYPLQTHDGKCVVNGFKQLPGSDETIFTNAMLWVIENVCPQLQEGIKEVNVPSKRFICEIVLKPDATKSTTYYTNAMFKVADGKLIYHFSDIEMESTQLMMKRLTPLEKLNPEKKEAHKQMLSDYERLASSVLNNLFDYVATNKPTAITHWSDIAIHRPVEGMTMDECRLAFGKPLSMMDTNGEMQWMYSTSFYLFFKNGVVSTIIK